MKPSEIIIDNIRGDGHRVEKFGDYKYGWIIYPKDGVNRFCRTVKELSDWWLRNQP